MTPGSAELTLLTTELKAVNEALWQIEDEIRLCVRDEDFSPQFISLARPVYRTNDRRGRANARSMNCSALSSWRRNPTRAELDPTGDQHECWALRASV
jgi:hypothetical protein